MRCRTCDYRLWNLRSRRCPECGTPFLPSEFEFTINSVQFCCPHCNQSYYGTGERGHLTPRTFDCVSCGRHIDMDEMVLLPTEGIREEQTETDHMPWLERRQRGRVKAWLSTIRGALVSPGRLIRAVPVDSRPVQAWVFAVFTNTLAWVLGMGLFISFPFVMGFRAAMRGGWPMALAFPISLAAMIGVFAIGTVVGIVIWGAAIHALLHLTGRTSSSVGRTYQAICYSAGASVPVGVPCLGMYFGWIWWLVSAVVMVKEAQRVSSGRAALATLAFPILLLVALGSFYMWMIYSLSTRAASFTATSPATSPAPTQLMVGGVLSYAATNGGRGPAHAIQLVTDAALSTGDFIAAGSFTVEENVPVGGVTLRRFEALSRREERRVIETAAKALPAGTIAHRLGDFVFTYHGIDLNKRELGLWLVVMSPDPDANPRSSPAPTIWVGCADGSVQSFPARHLPGQLASQNKLRAEAGLAPLPDPRGVTHAKPAVRDR